MENKIRQFNPEDLKADYREIAELIGVDNLILLSQHFGGNFQYIPQYRNLFKSRVYHQILSEFDGDNIKALARKYGVSYSTVYRLVKDEIKARRYAPMTDQLSLFQNNCQ